jgi:hypothetical protein
MIKKSGVARAMLNYGEKTDLELTGKNGDPPKIVVYTTTDPSSGLDRIADIVKNAITDITAVLDMLKDGTLETLPVELFEEYGDLEWVRNIPNLAANGLLTPKHLLKKLESAAVRSKNDTYLLLLATEYCTRQAVSRFGTAAIHGFGQVYEQALKVNLDIKVLRQKTNAIIVGNTGVDLGLSRENYSFKETDTANALRLKP